MFVGSFSHVFLLVPHNRGDARVWGDHFETRGGVSMIREHLRVNQALDLWIFHKKAPPKTRQRPPPTDHFAQSELPHKGALTHSSSKDGRKMEKTSLQFASPKLGLGLSRVWKGEDTGSSSAISFCFARLSLFRWFSGTAPLSGPKKTTFRWT